MAILAGDIKLVASQVMDDVPEGGGAPTSNIITDGTSNSIFNDISELDRAGGRVNLRKVFASVQTLDRDTYLGANVIVSDPPLDPKVSVTIFSTKSTFDHRIDAEGRIEAYLAPGPEWPGFLLENHITGQRAIQLFQRPNGELPPVGHTLVLTYHESQPDQRQQYVRITKVSVVNRTFSYSTGGGVSDYQADVVTCDISDALRYDFPGSPPSRTFAKDPTKTSAKDTVVADAAVYSGVVPLAAPVAIGDLKLMASSIFTQLVPSAQTETPIIDASASGSSNAMVDASNGLVTITTTQPFNPSTNLYLGNPVFPSSLSVLYSGGTLVDNAGQVYAGATAVGTIDYALGVIAWVAASPGYPGTKVVTFKAAGAPLQLADTAAIDVTQDNRGYNYVLTINPPPAPGTTKVSYRAQGKWYDVTDSGDGTLKGIDSSFGAGTVSYSTGTVSVTLGALPDAGSTILFMWGAKVNYINRASVAVAPTKVPLQLSHVGVTPSSVTITWNDGAARTATDNGKGLITGSASGTINYQTGLITLQPTTLPAGGQSYSTAYTYGPPDTEDFHAPARGGDGTISLALAKSSITPGTFELAWNVLIENYDAISETPAEMQIRVKTDPIVTVRDDGLGVLKDAAGVSRGTINYAAGTLNFHPDVVLSVPFPRYAVKNMGASVSTGGQVYRNTFIGFEYIPAGANMPLDESALATVKYRAAGSSTSASDTTTAGNLALDLTNQYAEIIVPGSINFTFGGRQYFDRSGQLYYDLDMLTGAATVGGNINYETGATTITSWPTGGGNSVAMSSLLTSLDGQPVDEVTFRAPVSPLRPGSLQVLATNLEGGQVNVTAGTDGAISGTHVYGTVEYDTGVVRLHFGQMVTAAGNEDEIWYDPAAVNADGKIFHPYPVFANTIKFNAVGFTYLPLDADLLGLDPVRLPQDGRVPIFRPGSFAVVGNTGTVGPATVSNGQTVNCGRVRLSRVRVVGFDGAVINTGYTADLEAGTVTFTDIAGYSQPVKVEHRIEDMALVSDAQINGQLSFTRPLTHNYPVLNTYISSALLAGDLHARVSITFDQATWGNVWADDPIGSTANGTYNTIGNPIIVTNKGALTERWAIVFTNTTSFNIVGEHVGQIGTGNTATDCAPINPATGVPYFSVAAAGWGGGWAAGNAFRFNTVGSEFPVWVIRTIQQGEATVDDDDFTLLIRGDVDKP